MMRLQRRSRKDYLIALAVFAVLIYALSPSSSPSFSGTLTTSAGELESARLERLMNSGTGANTVHLRSNSSFDWSSVVFRHPPPGPLRRLPVGRPVSLPPVQHPFPHRTDGDGRAAAATREARRRQVRDLFRRNWASYRKHAWMRDALQPLSGGFKEQFSGWAATLVDSLDTLWIMGLRREFDEAVEAVAAIDFGQSSSAGVNMFEVNIRYLGGLLAAYDLSKRRILLQKATELGDLLYAGYNTPNRMPVDFINFETAKTGDGLRVEGSVVSASPGTLSLEMTRLSQVTGDPKYYDAVSRVMDVFAAGQNFTRVPGLWPMYVSMRTKDVVAGRDFTVAGNADSLYEYLPKMYALLGGLEPRYAAMTTAALDATNATLVFRPMLPGEEDLLLVGNARVDGTTDEARLDPESEHLGCFVGGMYALAGRLLRRPEWAEIDGLGAKLTRGCVFAYRSMPTGIMPERFNTAPCESRTRCAWDAAAFDRERQQRPEWAPHLPPGFTTAKDPRYLLRPEAIESVFVLYRTTGRAEFQEAAWDMFVAIAKGTATPYANAAVLDVTKAEYPLPQEDYMEVRRRLP